MDIKEQLDALARPKQRCIELLVEKHGEEKRELLETAFNHVASAEKTATLLTTTYGIHVSDKLIQRHRNPDRDCGCE